MLTPQMTLSQQTQNSDELARIIGRDNKGRPAHVEISMGELHNKYGDTLDWTKTQFS
jgi:hypothetical protein